MNNNKNRYSYDRHRLEKLKSKNLRLAILVGLLRLLGLLAHDVISFLNRD